MIGGTENDVEEEGDDPMSTSSTTGSLALPTPPPVEARSSVVLDDSDYAIPDEWGLKEAYNDDESVVNHGDTLYIAGTHSLRDALDDVLIPLHLVRNSHFNGRLDLLNLAYL